MIKLLTSSLILSSLLFAGGNIAPVEPVIEEAPMVIEDSWKNSASMYMWGAGISGQTTLNTDIDISFSDILNNLDMAFMGTFTAQKGEWGFLIDYVHMNLGNDLGGVLLQRFDFKANIVTPTITYQLVNDDKLNLNLLVGAQYLYMKNKINGNENRATSGNAWDAIIGLKGQYNFSKHWFMPFQFDVGTGDTDFTWQAFAGLGYAYENFDVIAGWRTLNWEFDANNPGGKLFNDLAITGPMIGVKYRF